MKTKKYKESWDNRLFGCITMLILLALAALCLMPFLNLLAISLSDSGPVMRGEVTFWPKDFTIEVYRTIIRDGSLVEAMIRTIVVTVIYVLASMVMTILCAYPLSEPNLRGRKIIWPFVIFTMYFSGGMIPTYLLISDLGMIDSMASLILPGMISTYNMIVLRSFFTSIPMSLKESAYIDGAGDFKILMKIILPLSKPSLATIALFYGVSRWNGLQDVLLYINSADKALLQLKLKQMIDNTETIGEMMEGASATSAMVTETVRSGSLLFSLIPVLLVYPFLQKYFIKGVMIGAVKG